MYPGLSKSDFKSKNNNVSIVKQDEDFHVIKDNDGVFAGVNYSDSTKSFDINGTIVELKEKGMFVIKKKDNNTYECSFIIRHPQIPLQIKNQKFQLQVTL